MYGDTQYRHHDWFVKQFVGVSKGIKSSRYQEKHRKKNGRVQYGRLPGRENLHEQCGRPAPDWVTPYFIYNDEVVFMFCYYKTIMDVA